MRCPTYRTLGDIAVPLREMRRDGMTYESIRWVLDEQVYYLFHDRARSAYKPKHLGEYQGG